MSTGESLGTLRSDGAQRDLFNIEDLIGGRAVRILMPPRPRQNQAAATAAPPTIAVVGPTIAPPVSRDTLMRECDESDHTGPEISEMSTIDITIKPQTPRPERHRLAYATPEQSRRVRPQVGGGCGNAVVATPVSGW